MLPVETVTLPLEHFCTGALPLGSLPADLSSLSLPTFEADPNASPAQLAAAAAAAHVSMGTGPTVQGATPLQPQPQVPQPSTYSPTSRLPRKLVERIVKLEFVEMSEMLPETWVPESQDTLGGPRRISRRGPITDILVWVECFSLMAAVLAEKFPAKAPQLWAYLRRIVHAARNYQGSAWVAYDRLYRRQALAHHSLDWAQEDSALYNEAFVGHARPIARCRHCLSEFHAAEACPELPQTPPWPPQYAVGPTQMLPPPWSYPEICRKFNENRCYSRRCKYRHSCLNCGHPHPAVVCGNQPSSYGPPRLTRDRSPQRYHGRNQNSQRQ